MLARLVSNSWPQVIARLGSQIFGITSLSHHAQPVCLFSAEFKLLVDL